MLVEGCGGRAAGGFGGAVLLVICGLVFFFSSRPPVAPILEQEGGPCERLPSCGWLLFLGLFCWDAAGSVLLPGFSLSLRGSWFCGSS